MLIANERQVLSDSEGSERKLRSAIRAYDAVVIHPVTDLNYEIRRGEFVEPVVGALAFDGIRGFVPYAGVTIRFLARNENATVQHYFQRQLGLSLAIVPNGFVDETEGRYGLLAGVPLLVGITYHLPYLDFLQAGIGVVMYNRASPVQLQQEQEFALRHTVTVSLQLPTQKIGSALGALFNR